MHSSLGRAAVFLDRDGTLIRDVGYLCCEEQIEILPRVPDALRLIHEKGFKVVVVTNQSVVARGRLAEQDLLKINQALMDRLAQSGARLDGFYYCPHHATEGIGSYKIDCACRKPKDGMIKRASAELRIDPAISYVVGDQVTDIQLANAVGAKGILICDSLDNAANSVAPNAHCVSDLWQAAEWIIHEASL